MMKILYEDIEFNEFVNTQELFEEYCDNQTEFGFKYGFEYIHEIHLVHPVLYLRDDNGRFLFYIIEKKKDNQTGEKIEELLAYDPLSYLYFLKKYGRKLIIKFAQVSRLDSLSLKHKTPASRMDIEVIHYPENIIAMTGSKYADIRWQKSNFLKNAGELVFRKYNDYDYFSVMELYKEWETDYRRRYGEGSAGQTHGKRAFKKGLEEEEYMQKYVLLSNGVFIGFCSFYVSGVWAYNYTIKYRSDIKHTSLYLYLREFEEIHKQYPDVKYINSGQMKNPRNPADFKRGLIPDAYYKILRKVEVLN